MLAKLSVFLWKDWVEARSYRAAFLLRSGTMLLPLVILVFLDRVFGGLNIPAIEPYGGNYVAFALVGIVVATYSDRALRSFSGSLRHSQQNGTLESLFLTRAGLYTMLFGWSLYPMARSTVNMLAFLIVGFAVLRVPLGDANPVGVLLTLALTVTVMASLGILAAGFTLLFKQPDVFTRLVLLASALLSGTVYPVAVLPGSLQAMSKLLPQTHAIEAVRLAVFNGYSTAELVPYLGALLAFAAVLLPLSLSLFQLAAHRAKVEGSLAHY